MHKFWLIPLALLVAPLLCEPELAVAESSEAEVLQEVSANWWASETLTVEGYGIAFAPDTGKLLARRAAIMDGQRNLAEAAGKVQITAGATLTTQKIDALVKGAAVISENYDANGIYTVTMSVPIYGVTESFAAAAFSSIDREDFPAPASEVAAEGGYTGLIIDCGGLELNPVLLPAIRSAKNQSIYGYSNLDYDKVLANGMIGYAEAPPANDELVILTSAGGGFLMAKADENLSRAGNNPLVIKAEALSEDNTCPVISAEDADKILAENLASHFLDEGAVVFTSNRIRGMRL